MLGLVGATAAGLLLYAALLALEVRLLSAFVRPGTWPRESRQAWAAWAVARTTAEARGSLYPLYASVLTPAWFRLLGARVGRDVEISTASGIPCLMDLGDACFLADDTLVAPPVWQGRHVLVGRTRVGARSFVGNSGIVRPGTRIGDDALVAVLSTAPDVVRDGEAWIGRPARPIQRTPDVADASRTYAPTTRLRVARSAVEACRLLPFVGSGAMALGLLTYTWHLCLVDTMVQAMIGVAEGLVAGALVAVALSLAAKWLLVGRIRPGEHPLWSSFVWRNELADCFLECLAVPWCLAHCYGTPVLNLWHRLSGAHVGRDVWCDTHWLPEADLVVIGDGATISHGTVVQTHLFQDRVMRLETVRIEAGATLGAHCVVLPQSTVGEGTSLEVGSLAMRGETLPGHSRWGGNPVRLLAVASAPSGEPARL